MPKYTGYDFCGWATRNDLRCSDGRTIRRDAFAHQDGQKVPLVWGHNHDSPEAVLGHGFLENRPEGVFFYGYFNDSDLAQSAKHDVQHGDITSLSIWANQLQQKAGDVLHGSIKEVSLVLAGANMGAQITYPVVAHGDDYETLMDEAYIYVGDDYGLELSHADDEPDGEPDEKPDEDRTVRDVLNEMTDEQKKVVSFLVAQAAAEGLGDGEEAPEENGEEELSHADSEEEDAEEDDEEGDSDMEDNEKTVQDVLDSMDEDQMAVLNYLVGKAAAEGLDDDADEEGEEDFEHSEGGYPMNFNAFDGAQVNPAAFLSHSDEQDIVAVAKKYGSLKQAIEAYAEENELSHDDLKPASGFDSYPATPGQGVEALFPEWHDVRPGAPELVTNDQAWVKAVLGKVHKSPFSRIRTSQVDIREIEDIRAKGYLKGKEKVLAGNYTVAKRTTSPQTVYVRSALNHDDIVDITDFSYVDYQYTIDRMQLELELARAILFGDGRDAAAADKINPENIRNIYEDADLYTIVKVLDTSAPANDPGFGENYRYAEATEDAILDAKIDYRGSGNMDMFCTQQFFNKLQLAKDLNGRRLYSNKSELTTALDVNNVYAVSEMANKTRVRNGKTYRLLAIIGNLNDYAMGSTKGGEIVHRTQFDIDFNQEKSLLETRASGATTRIYSFIVLEEEVVQANP